MKTNPLSSVVFLPRLCLGALTGLWLVLSGAGTAEGQTFGAHGVHILPGGNVPEDLRIADFNGDGALDLAIANSDAAGSASPDNVYVYRNLGGGLLAAPVSYSVGERPEGITTGLFDAGTSIDVATANYGSSTVSILLNSSGSFGAGGTIGVPGGPRSIVSGDFDEDGKVDLVTSNYDNGSVSFLKGAGNGSFTLQDSFSVGAGPEVVSAGKINNDAHLDLVTANSVSNTVSVLLGNGNGTFTFLTDIAVGSRPRYVKLVDLDGDTLAEVLSANHNSGTVTVHKNNAGASFSLSVTLTITGMSGPVYLNTGDLDGNGRQDIVVSYALSDKAGIFPGTGPLTFGPGELLATGTNPLGIGIADLDGSGSLDIVISNALDNNAFLYLSGSGLPSVALDNGAPGTTPFGTWSSSGAPNPFGSGSVYAKSVNPATRYRWDVPLPQTGTYFVYAWWTALTSRVTTAPYEISHSGGVSTVMVDQTRNGGQWNFLGSFSFGSTTARVEVVATSASSSTCADAICVVRVLSGGSPPTASITSITPDPAAVGQSVSFVGAASDTDGVIAAYEWTSSRDGILSTSASFSTTLLTAGTHAITFRARDNDGLWSPTAQSSVTVNSTGGAHTLVIDNGDAGTSFTGNWAASSGPSPFGLNSLYAKNGATYNYNFTLPAAGTYQVFGWWTQFSSRPTAAPIHIQHSSGTSTVNVNQQIDGGQWNLLGTFTFGASALVTVEAVGSASTCADAFCLVSTGATNSPPTAQIASITPSPAVQGDNVTFTGTAQDSDGSVVAYEWYSSINGLLSTLQSFSTPGLSVGTHTISFRARDNGGVWSLLAESSLVVSSPGGGQTFILDNGDPGTSFTGSWTVSSGPSPYGANSLYAKNGPTYTYTFTGLSPGTYEVAAWWTQLASRPSAAPIDIIHSSGTTTIPVDQRTNGGQWNALGSFNFGSTATIRIRAEGTASTCADAIRLVGGGGGPAGDVIVDNGDVGTSQVGTWSVSSGPNPFGTSSLYAKNGPTYTFTTSLNGTYNVYAWWTELSSRPTAAPIDILSQSGTTTVNVNQQVNGGQWNLLGTFTFNGSASVVVRAVGTASTCADAVRFEPVP